ncbi:MFS general substrate transporter [Panus rudis PR-1116 ss-1]|nr:MFS general substrate transporter [Panus rudis PR-1116 ss-1]
MIVLITSLTLLIIALNLGGEARPWKSPTIIGLFAGAGGAFLAFVFAEKSAKYPVVPMGLFASMKWRNVPLMTVVRCLLFFHLFATTFYVPIFLQVIGHPEVLAAALVIPFLLMAAVASLLNSYIVAKTGLIRPVFLASLVILPVGLGLMSTLNQYSSIGQIVGYSLICGFGFGGGTQLTLLIAQVGLPSDLLPTVTAMVSATPNLGGVLGVGIIGTIINNTFRMRLQHLVGSLTIPHINDAVTASKDLSIGANVVVAYVHAFQLGFKILAGIAVVQLVLCLGARRVTLQGGEKEKKQEQEQELCVVRGGEITAPIEMQVVNEKKPADSEVQEVVNAV